jgi:DNA-directed RNA polymerase specialized sigma24 family protein
MKRITINESLNFLRKSLHYEDISKVNIEDNGIIAEHLELELYYTMIKELPDMYRIVFNLYAIEGYSHYEISELIEIKESSSRVYLMRARTMLQEKNKKL